MYMEIREMRQEISRIVQENWDKVKQLPGVKQSQLGFGIRSLVRRYSIILTTNCVLSITKRQFNSKMCSSKNLFLAYKIVSGEARR